MNDGFCIINVLKSSICFLIIRSKLVYIRINSGREYKLDLGEEFKTLSDKLILSITL